jgi:hypothetical protein
MSQSDEGLEPQDDLQDTVVDDAADDGQSDGDTPDLEDFLRAEKGEEYQTEVLQAEADAAAGLASGEPNEEDGQRPETDDREEPKAEEPKAKAPPAEERLVRRLQKSEARVVELERALRESQTQPPQSGFAPSGDLIGDVIGLAAAYLGPDVRQDDPRVQAQLRQIGVGLVAELAGETADPELARIRQSRAEARRHAEVQRQIDDLKRQGAQKDAQLREAEARTFVSVGLKELDAESEYPFLFAAEDDVTSAVYQGLDALHARGYQIRSRQDAVDAMAYVCKTLEDEHRRTAERLERAKSGRKSAVTPNQPSTETRGPQKDGASGRSRGEDRGRGKTVTASGTGNRQAPQPKAETAMTADELLEQTLREDREERRRAAAQRTRR